MLVALRDKVLEEIHFMKKILGVIILSVTMLINCVPASAANPKSLNQDSRTELLQTLGIVDSEPGDLSEIISREDFAILIAKAFNIPVVKTHVRYFTDVEQDGYAVDTINTLVERNIISTNAENKFRPMEQIKYNEACKMLVSALGYNVVAEMQGGWPNGYLYVSAQIGLKSNGNAELLTKKDAYNLIYEALVCEINSMIINGDGSVEYKQNEGKTALLEYHDIDCFSGTITAAYGVTTDSDITASKNEIYVNGEIYETNFEFNPEEYVGSYCDVWVHTEKNSDEKTVIYLSQSSKAKETVKFSIDDFASINSGSVSYYEGKGSSEKNLKLESPYVIYNGSPLKNGYEMVFNNLNKGEISVFDSDGNGVYDIVSVVDYKNFIVGAKSDNKIYNKALSGNYIDMEKDYDGIRIEDVNGGILSPDDILVGCTLSVAEDQSGNNLKIVVSASEVDGRVQGTYYDEDNLIVIVNDISYKFDKSYLKSISDSNGNLTKSLVAEQHSFKLDHYNNITWFDYSSNSMMVGLALSTGQNSDDENKVMLKVYTENNQAVLYDCADNLKVDGVRIKSYKDFINSFPNPIGVSGVMMQVIRYTLNSDNEIDSIDTSNFNSSYESKENSLIATYDYPQMSWYNSGRIGIKTWIDNDTITFFVPSGVEHPNTEDIYCGLYSYLIVNDFTLSVNPYRFGDGKLSADALICEYETNDIAANFVNSAKAIMFDSLSEGLDEDGEVVQILTGYSAGAKKTYIVPMSISFDGVEQGDLIRLYYGIDNKVSGNERTNIGCDYELICKRSDILEKESPGWKNNSHFSNYYAEQGNSMYNYYKEGFQFSFGFVSRKDNNLVAWSYEKSDAIDEVANISGPIVIYNAAYSNPHDRIKIGSVADLLDYKTVGDGCSMILYHTRHGAQIETFAYQR